MEIQELKVSHEKALSSLRSDINDMRKAMYRPQGNTCHKIGMLGLKGIYQQGRISPYILPDHGLLHQHMGTTIYPYNHLLQIQIKPGLVLI